MNKNWLEHILKQHHNDAFLWANQCCMYNQDDAKEVLQNVYLKILEGKATYHQKSEFKTWLFSVIRNTSIDFMKKKHTYYSLEAAKTLEAEPNESDEINYQKILSQLPERQHQTLLLSFYHGMTLQEISEVMNVHIGTVRTHYERGKQALKRIILKEKV